MKKSYFFINLLLLFFLNNIAQSFDSHKVTVDPEKYQPIGFDIDAYKEYLRIKYDSMFLLESRRDNFANQTARFKKTILSSDLIYTNLHEEISYLDSVLYKTLNNKYDAINTEVRIVKDPSINAFSIEDGSVNINIGTLALLNNEAELASLISHEFGHSDLKHSYKRFKWQSNILIRSAIMSLFSYTGYLGQLIDYAIYSGRIRKGEKDADYYAIKKFKQNRYNVNGILSMNNHLKNLEEHAKYIKGHKKKSVIYRSHPFGSRRLKIMSKKVKEIENPGSMNFLVDSISFGKLKKRTTDESIYLLFKNNQFDECIEFCYMNHLLLPNDEYYQYFLLESLRLQNEINPNFCNKPFITWRYKRKYLNGKSIHTNLEKVYKMYWQQIKDKIKGALSEPSDLEFFTNSDALEYFKSYAVANCKSCSPVLSRFGHKEITPIKSEQELLYSFIKESQCSSDIIDISNNTPIFFNRTFTSYWDNKLFNYYLIDSNSIEQKMFINWIQEMSNPENAQSYIDYLPRLNYVDRITVSNQLARLATKSLHHNSKIKNAIRKKHHFRGSKKIKKTYSDPRIDAPSVLCFANEVKCNSIIFVEFLIQESQRGAFVETTKKVKARIYYYDLKNKLLYSKFKNLKVKYFSDYQFRRVYPELVNAVNELKSEVLIIQAKNKN
ncbi:MAG: M48 family metalloprotease [Bacteroidia bacterium]